MKVKTIKKSIFSLVFSRPSGFYYPLLDFSSHPFPNVITKNLGNLWLILGHHSGMIRPMEGS